MAFRIIGYLLHGRVSISPGVAFPTSATYILAGFPFPLAFPTSATYAVSISITLLRTGFRYR